MYRRTAIKIIPGLLILLCVCATVLVLTSCGGGQDADVIGGADEPTGILLTEPKTAPIAGEGDLDAIEAQINEEAKAGKTSPSAVTLPQGGDLAASGEGIGGVGNVPDAVTRAASGEDVSYTDTSKKEAGGVAGTSKKETGGAAGTSKEEVGVVAGASKEGAAVAAVPENKDSKGGMTCKISIECRMILDNMDKLAAGKEEVVPPDGVILAELEVPLYEGESAFDVLARVTKDERIHMEHSKTPVYKSSYIEGISNLYEFDCGPLSGWMYAVNGAFPAYGASSYVMNDGDVLAWSYTCDLGRDIGGDLEAQR